MEQHGPQVFWTNMMRQRSELEADHARTCAAALSGPRDGSTQMAAPACSYESDSLLDGEKTRAMLLFSGVALAVLGVTFTFMGWRYHQTNPTFEWLKLLGPILISVGVTFVLTSVCKCTDFGWSRRRGHEDVLVMSVTEQASRGRCHATSGQNQPITIHNVTAIFGAPPEYSFATQEGRQGVGFQPRSPVCGICAAPPPAHGTVYCVDNAALTSQEASSRDRENRSEKPEHERGREDSDGSIGSCPPVYEDIYPSFSSQNLP